MLQLPAELVLKVLSYLSLSDLAKFLLISKEWKEFVDLNEVAIFHCAAFLHDFIPSRTTPYSEVERMYTERSLKNVPKGDWKAFGRRRLWIKQAWMGRRPNYNLEHIATGLEVHRIKVDEDEGIVIVTTQDGNLIVSGFEATDGDPLWALPEDQIREFAHCEYEKGYLIFDRYTGEREVWRLSSHCARDTSETEVVDDSKPDDRQLRCHESSLRQFPTTTRGHFTPWAILRTDHHAHASRFVYPTLLVTSWDQAFLYNVPTGELVQVIDTLQAAPGASPSGDPSLGTIFYVEQSARHVFACGMLGIRIWSKETGRAIMDISSLQSKFGNWFYMMEPMIEESPSNSWSHRQELVEYPVRSIHASERREHQIEERFISAHVSSCGKHLAALTVSSKLVIVIDFEKVVPNAEGTQDTLQSHTLEIQLGSPIRGARYLAFDHGRVAACTDSGIYVIHPSFTLSNDPTSPPPLRLARLPFFKELNLLASISCLQMSETGLFFNWGTSSDLGEVHIPETEDELFQNLRDYSQALEKQNGLRTLLRQRIMLPDGPAESSTVWSINFVPLHV
ncbi:hypothetical protein BDN72DRAFT_791910 [Pluteus cervinus]|uniref:Uncharacterized protein n=1 Tax=Pluteus cervinus TaxID=181527 RepID=A0ACD3B735_9AGAR|nr:hypothetical protein BDN72DRAFT_791910 [Pluteus cervinus]